MKNSLIIGSAALFMVFGIAMPAHPQDQQTEKKDKHEQKQETKKEATPDQRAQQQQDRDRQSQPAQPPRQYQDRQQQRPQRTEDRQIQDRENHDRQNQDQQSRPDRKRQQQDRSREQEQRIRQMQDADRQQRQGQEQQRRQDDSRQQQRDRLQPDSDMQRRQQRLQDNPELQRAWQNHRARSWQSDHRTWQARGGYSGYRIPEDRYRGYFGPQHSFRISGQPFMVYNGYPRFQYEGYWITLLDPWPEYWSNEWYDNDDVYVDYEDDGYYMYNRRYPNVGIAISISR